MTSDQKAQIEQIHQHRQALLIDFSAAESAGASIPAIHDARDLLEAAIKKAEEAINTCSDTTQKTCNDAQKGKP
jgi:prefoldin subunit 5